MTNTGARPARETVQVYVRDLVTWRQLGRSRAQDVPPGRLAPGRIGDGALELPASACSIVTPPASASSSRASSSCWSARRPASRNSPVRKVHRHLNRTACPVWSAHPRDLFRVRQKNGVRRCPHRIVCTGHETQQAVDGCWRTPANAIALLHETADVLKPGPAWWRCMCMQVRRDIVGAGGARAHSCPGARKRARSCGRWRGGALSGFDVRLGERPPRVTAPVPHRAVWQRTHRPSSDDCGFCVEASAGG